MSLFLISIFRESILVGNIVVYQHLGYREERIFLKSTF